MSIACGAERLMQGPPRPPNHFGRQETKHLSVVSHQAPPNQNVKRSCRSILRFGVAPPPWFIDHSPRARYWPKYGDERSPFGGAKFT